MRSTRLVVDDKTTFHSDGLDLSDYVHDDYQVCTGEIGGPAAQGRLMYLMG